MNSQHSSFSIKNWAEDDRPREKLLLKGKNALSNAELIAILIRSGTSNESAVALAKRILTSANENLHQIATMNVAELTKFKGIGTAKAITIITALELGRRQRLQEALELPKITSSSDVFNVMHPIIGELQHEEFWVLFLNNAHKIIDKKQLSKGGLTATVVDVRLLFKYALQVNAVSIVLCHNHPSGLLKPSNADIEITQKLVNAGKTLDVKILDHLIISNTSYFSFTDNNTIPFNVIKKPLCK